MIVLDKIRLTGRLLNFFISQKTRSSSLFFAKSSIYPVQIKIIDMHTNW